MENLLNILTAAALPALGAVFVYIIKFLIEFREVKITLFGVLGSNGMKKDVEDLKSEVQEHREKFIKIEARHRNV